MDTQFLEEMCRTTPVSVVKVTHMMFGLVRDMLENEAIGPQLQVLLLVRDPRSVMNSRWKRPWCDTVDCKDARVTCQDEEDDFMEYVKLKKEYPDKLHMMRFEDFALSPSDEFKRLFNEMNLEYTSTIDAFIQRQTESQREHNVKTTRRDSQAEVMPWATSDTFSDWDLDYVQKACTGVMQKLGYGAVANRNESSVHKVVKPFIHI